MSSEWSDTQARPLLAAVAGLASTASVPSPRTSLVGRVREVACGHALLVDDGVPLLTLTGPGGVGKTRLALALAHDVAPAFADGVVFLDLARIADSAQAAPLLARALELPETNDSPSTDVVLQSLRPRQQLLVLDNCEHLLPGLTEFVGALLPACPAVQVLATSRSRLHVRGEHELPVLPLAVPQRPLTTPFAPDGLPPLERLAEIDAVNLFIQRARAVSNGFRLTPDNVAAVVEICIHLEGLPLAIELAAARIRLLSPQALAALLGERFKVLTDGPHDAPPRQRALRDAIAWSHDLLSPAAQLLFRRLAVFVGGCSLAAIAAVGDADEIDMLRDLDALADQGLLRAEDGIDGERRYVMLETVREFAQEQLDANGESAWIRQAHASHFLTLAETAEPQLTGPDERRWFRRLEADEPNLREALHWFVDRDDAERAWRLAGALFRYWQLRGEFAEARARLEEALALSSAPRGIAWAKAQTALGYLLRHDDDDERASIALAAALDVWRKEGDRRGVARTLTELTAVELNAGDLDQARALGEEAVSMLRELDDVAGTLSARHVLGVVFLLQGELVRARDEIEESLRLAAVMDSTAERAALRSLAWIALAGGRDAEAAALWEERLAWARDVGHEPATLTYLDDLGLLALRHGDHRQAAERFREELELAAKRGDRWHVARSLAGLAMMSAAAGHARRAASLFGAAESLSVRSELDYDPQSPIQTPYLHAFAETRRALGAAFAEEYRKGQELPRRQSIEEAVSFAASFVAEADHRQAPPGVAVERLTRREEEVLRLLAQRLTDQEIADALYVGRRTINHHVAQILDKLEAGNRREAVATASRLGLV